jgi:4-carboxymuconolactone decarboxylase
MTSKNLPEPLEKFQDLYPDVWKAFLKLGDQCHDAGPLDEKSRRLIKVALAIGAGLEGGTHSAVRNALAVGIDADEIKHVAVLAITTLGFPSAIRALTWINDHLKTED